MQHAGCSFLDPFFFTLRRNSAALPTADMKIFSGEVLSENIISETSGEERKKNLTKKQLRQYKAA